MIVSDSGKNCPSFARLPHRPSQARLAEAMVRGTRLPRCGVPTVWICHCIGLAPCSLLTPGLRNRTRGVKLGRKSCIAAPPCIHAMRDRAHPAIEEENAMETPQIRPGAIKNPESRLRVVAFFHNADEGN